MTSPRWLVPKAVHTAVTHHLYVQKKPYTDPNSTPDSTKKSVNQNHPLVKKTK